jgi:hypothetical protein
MNDQEILEEMKPSETRVKRIQLTLVLVAYVICALIFGFAYKYAINPDGVSQLRLAGYLAEGEFLRSVTSGLSPLTIWLISIFLYFGFDGLTGARIAIALGGAGMLLCSWFLALRFYLSGSMRFIAVLIAALLISFWTIQFISADIFVAALTLCYVYLVTDPDTISKRKLSFVCGVVGGLSYLAHHYALPFFLVHFPLLLFIRGYFGRDREEYPWRKVFISWGSGMAGFLIITLAWIGILSAKYGHLTITAKGGAAHAVVGPKDIDRRHPFFVGGLFKPRDEYALHVFEDTSEVEFKTWSPFENKEYFIHQFKVIKDNAVYILNHFVNKSPFFTSAFVIGILALIPFALLLITINNKKKFLYAWVILTFSVYCSGFLLLIAKSPRRFYALMIIFLFVLFHFIEELKNACRDFVPGRKGKMLVVYLVIIAVSAFAFKPGRQLMNSIKHLVTHEQLDPYPEIAEQINTVQFPAPFAVVRSSQKPTTDYYIAYFLKKQLLGRPLSADVHGITRELKAAGGRSLLVFDNPEITEELKLDGRYVHLASVKLKDNTRYKHAAGWIVVKHEIISGWDEEVNIFTLK